MRLLLVSQAYPPYPAVGSIRAQKVARMLRDRGHEVFVITERLAGEGDGPREPGEPGIQVHTVPLGPPYRVRALNTVRRVRGRQTGEGTPSYGPPPTVATEVASVPARNKGLLRRAVLSLFWLPDDEVRFVRPALRAARELMRDHRMELVYTSTPPHSTHLVGLRLREANGLRWVAEFRDPWTDQRTPERVEHWFAPVEAMHRWLERRCLNAADTVVAVTEGARRSIAAKLPEAKRGKVIAVLNGIGAIEALPPRRDGPLRIVHAGTFYLDRDPRPFLRALARLRAERDLGPGDVMVELLGRCRTFGEVSVEGEVQALGLDDIVRFHDWVPHEEARAMLTDADLLLLLATAQPLQVPNKLYDYLGSRKPVLGIVDAGGESERMLVALGGQYVVSVKAGERVSDDAILNALRSALDASGGGANAVDEDLLREWSVEHQMEQLATAIRV